MTISNLSVSEIGCQVDWSNGSGPLPTELTSIISMANSLYINVFSNSTVETTVAPTAMSLKKNVPNTDWSTLFLNWRCKEVISIGKLLTIWILIDPSEIKIDWNLPEPSWEYTPPDCELIGGKYAEPLVFE